MATLKRGNHTLPPQSQVLGRDLTAETIQHNAGKRAVAYVLTDSQRAEARHPYRVIVKSPESAALAWTAFETIEAFENWIAAYCLGYEGEAEPGEIFSVVIPECPRFMPLVETQVERTIATSAGGMYLHEDDSAPERFAVWSPEGDIVGSGPTATAALAEARKTITEWQRLRAGIAAARLVVLS